jgi:hypothetical protein
MAKAVTLAFLAVLVGGVSTSAAGEEGAPAPEAAPEAAVVIIRRQSTSLTQIPATRQDGQNDSLSIAREAQKELQRLGCYDGESSGVWSQASRVAAQRFLDRVNAKLPTDKAEEALLSLLKGQSTGVCSLCPHGQAFDSAGRCMPTALLKQSASPIVSGSLSDTPAVEAPVRSKDERAPPDQPVEQDQSATGGHRTQPNSKPSKWQKFIRSVDKALGLN